MSVTFTNVPKCFFDFMSTISIFCPAWRPVKLAQDARLVRAQETQDNPTTQISSKLFRISTSSAIKPAQHRHGQHDNSCWEANESLELDRNQNVRAWVKNDHINFEITYSFKGIIHKFRPDYLIRLTNGNTLVLEVKGQDDQQQQTKREFLAEWVRAVNGHGGFGEWSADVSRHPKDVEEILRKHNA